MRTWKNIEVDVLEGIQLDPQNVRLDPRLGGATQADLITDLFVNEDAMQIVEGIARLGYLDHETPIGLYRRKKLFMVEGNRRLAALKAIQNPMLALSHRKRIENLTIEVDRDALRHITVKIAPNQDQANQLIAALHTGAQRKSWRSTRQQAFFQAQIDAGRTPAQLIANYPTVRRIRRYVINGQIVKRFREAHYSDSRLSEYIDGTLHTEKSKNPEKFPITTLERFLENPVIQEIAAIQVDDESNVTVLSTTVFEAVAEHLMSGILNDEISPRKQNRRTDESYGRLIEELRETAIAFGGAPTSSGRIGSGGSGSSAPAAPASRGNSHGPSTGGAGAGAGTGTSSGAGGNAGWTGTGSGTPAGSGTGTGGGSSSGQQPAAGDDPLKQRANLSTEDLTVNPAHPPAIHAMMQEMRTLSIKLHPNATLDLFRSFLEKGIKSYADSKGQVIPKGGNQPAGFIQLGDCLAWLEGYIKTQPSKKSLLQVIRRIQQGINAKGNYNVTLDYLNATNHNHHVYVTTEDVRSYWNMAKPLIKELLAG